MYKKYNLVCKWLFSLMNVKLDIRKNTSPIDQVTQLCFNLQV